MVKEAHLRAQCIMSLEIAETTGIELMVTKRMGMDVQDSNPEVLFCYFQIFPPPQIAIPQLPYCLLSSSPPSGSASTPTCALVHAPKEENRLESI